MRFIVFIYKKNVKNLKIMRNQLKEDIQRIVDKYGNMFVEKFENKKLMRLKRSNTWMEIEKNEALDYLQKLEKLKTPVLTPIMSVEKNKFKGEKAPPLLEEEDTNSPLENSKNLKKRE